MPEFRLSELELEKNWYHRKNFKCPFLNQGDVPYRKPKVSLKAYFIDFFCKLELSDKQTSVLENCGTQ